MRRPCGTAIRPAPPSARQGYAVRAAKPPSGSLSSVSMSETKIYPPPPGFAAHALINASTYASMYRESVTNIEAFWAKQARERLTWSKPFTQVKDTSFDANDLHVRWF